MARCSVDGSECCDDMCYGGGCIAGGVLMFRCDFCHNYYDEDMGCECADEPDNLWPQDDEPESPTPSGRAAQEGGNG